MKKYSKKIALILVLTLVLATAIPALAAGQKTEITGAYKDQELHVIVPGNMNAILNPLGLPAKLLADDGTVLALLKTPGQVVTDKPLIGVNLSGVDLSVGAKVSGEVSGQFKLATSAPSKTATSNTGLVYLQVKKVDNLAYTNTPDTATNVICGSFDGTKVKTELEGWDLPTGKFNSKATDSVLVSTKEVTKSGLCVIKASKDTDTDFEPDTPDTGSYFIARLVGDIVKKPKSDWKETDKVKVSITWEFEPA